MTRRPHSTTLVYSQLAWLTGGNIATFFVFWLIQINLSWLSYKLTSSAFLLGLLGFALNLPMLLFMPIAGVVADRYSRKTLLIISQLCYWIPNLVLFWLVQHKQLSYSVMLTVGMLYGSLFSFSKPASDAIVYNLVETNTQLKIGISLSAATRQLALLLASPLNKLLLLFFQLPSIFIACGVMNLLGAWCFVRLKPKAASLNPPTPIEEPSNTAEKMAETKPVAPTKRTIWRDLWFGIRYVITQPKLLSIILLLSLALGTIISIQFQFPAVIAHYFKGNKRYLYQFYLASALGGLSGAGVLMIKKHVESLMQLLIEGCLIAQALSVLLIPLWPNPFFVWILIYLIDAFGMTATIAGTLYIQRHIDDRHRGRVMSLLMVSRIAAIPIASLILGILMGLGRVGFGLIGYACIYLILMLIWLWRSRYIRSAQSS